MATVYSHATRDRRAAVAVMRASAPFDVVMLSIACKTVPSGCFAISMRVSVKSQVEKIQWAVRE